MSYVKISQFLSLGTFYLERERTENTFNLGKIILFEFFEKVVNRIKKVTCYGSITLVSAHVVYERLSATEEQARLPEFLVHLYQDYPILE